MLSGTQRRFLLKCFENKFLDYIQSTFRPLQMHSMYKICICSGGHPRETFKVFSKLQGLHYQFRCNLALYESEFFFLFLSPSHF